MRVLALDVGEKTIGVAVSDPTRLIARPVGTICRRGYAADLAAVQAVVDELGVAEFVVGYPVHAGGGKGEAVKRVERLARRLKSRFGLPVTGVDERYSTLEARQWQGERPASRRSGAGDDNPVAAAIILQRYLQEGDNAVLARW